MASLSCEDRDGLQVVLVSIRWDLGYAIENFPTVEFSSTVWDDRRERVA